MADDILGLLQQFEPTAADKKQALYNSLLAAGLGMMGARRGDEMAAVGRGGLLGMANYQNILNTKEKAAIDRMQAATMAMNIREKQRQFADADQERTILKNARPAAMVGDQSAMPQQPTG